MEPTSTFDWTAFGLGFAAATAIALFLRYRAAQSGRLDLSAPPSFKAPFSTPPAAPYIPPPVTDLSPELKAQILLLKAQGQKIEAVRMVRQRTGLGLKESKDLVEAIL
jgi:large subunit ribosomal protein L7/L12